MISSLRECGNRLMKIWRSKHINCVSSEQQLLEREWLLTPVLREKTITGFFCCSAPEHSCKRQQGAATELHSKSNICLIGQLGSNKEEFSPFVVMWAEMRHRAGREQPSTSVTQVNPPRLVYLWTECNCYCSAPDVHNATIGALCMSWTHTEVGRTADSFQQHFSSSVSLN